MKKKYMKMAIREAYKRQGYGHMQLAEAINRIKQYPGLERIIVCTNEKLVAPRNYESVGFSLYDRKENIIYKSKFGYLDVWKFVNI